MYKRKNMYKLCLSLLIAMAFILPGASVMGTPTQKDEASVTTTAPDMVKIGDGPIAQEDPFCGVYLMGLNNLPDGAMIPPDTYNLDLALWYDPACYFMYGPPIVKLFIEVYEHQCGADILMYETSFEDNFDIYNNWMQVDRDCGVDKEGNPGFFDTWTWTDARASCGSEHSMKNTMYDIYKGNQDDYLECTKSFDISKQQGIKIEFDVWVEGDYNAYYAAGFYNPLTGVTTSESTYTVFDYLDFEVGDDGGNWLNPDYWFNGAAIADDPATPDVDETDYMIFTGAADDGFRSGAYKFPDTALPIYDPSPYQNYLPKAVSKGGGWWTVTWYCDTWYLEYIGLNIEDIQFRFSWHSDAEQQFEGAYVDCVKVYSRETYKVKVHQTHTQGPVVLDPENWETQPGLYYDNQACMWYYRLPLPWVAQFVEQCGQKTTGYQIWAWMEVLNDPCTYWTQNDWPDYADINVQVGEWACTEVDNLLITSSTSGDTEIIYDSNNPAAGSGVITTGMDAHIQFDVHATGITPQTNVNVEAYAEKVYWETLYETSFDSALGWTFADYYETDAVPGSLWHISDFTSWDEGGKALAWNLASTNHYVDSVTYDTAQCGEVFDITDCKALVLDYYYKMIFAGSGDYYRILLQDPSTNYVLSSYPNSFGATNPRTGYYPEWTGSLQPMCRYSSIDLLALYNYWHDIRFMFRNADGSDSTELGIGFAAFSDATGYVNTQAEADGNYWSGLFLDEVKVRAELVGEEVWHESLVIPGPLEPCDVAHVQFEWENVPPCNYKVTVKAENGCANEGQYMLSTQILSTSIVEVATNKEMEGFDYTGTADGEWGISTSDYDNYLATNPDSTKYPADMNAIAQLCPDNAGNCGIDSGQPCCIDISHLTLADGVLLMDMDMWWDVEGYGYDYCYLEIAAGCPANQITDWIQLIGWGNGDPFPESSIYYAMTPGEDADWCAMSDPAVEADLTAWLQSFIPTYTPGPNGEFDLGDVLMFYGVTTEFSLRFRFTSDPGFNFRGMKFDDLTITDMIYDDSGFPPIVKDFVDPMDDMHNWCTQTFSFGNFWTSSNDQWCINAPAGYDLSNAIVWTTEIQDVYEAYFTFASYFQFGSCSKGLVQIREMGGEWRTLYEFTGTSPGYPAWNLYTIHKDISAYAGKQIQIRFLFDGSCGGIWCIKNLQITGKKDNTLPVSTATMSGTMKDSGWYTTAVKITITATDTGSGVKEIHYILDGVEKVVAGDKAEVTVSGNGEHTFEYWAVDNSGNAEAHHVLPTFRIDSGAKPTISITAPTPGIYFMGKKIMSSSNTIIIGGFTVEATAADVDSGIYRVSFYLDGNVVADDTTAPYSAYICAKHKGAATLKAVAEDFAQNTAEAEMSLKYFKFF